MTRPNTLRAGAHLVDMTASPTGVEQVFDVSRCIVARVIPCKNQCEGPVPTGDPVTLRVYAPSITTIDALGDHLREHGIRGGERDTATSRTGVRAFYEFPDSLELRAQLHKVGFGSIQEEKIFPNVGRRNGR